ncbi:MAG: hypothetical protein Q7U11_12140, partial [Phenylobacterium sp.]|nr:hypothetical protein [Phenylobacterium sp.]
MAHRACFQPSAMTVAKCGIIIPIPPNPYGVRICAARVREVVDRPTQPTYQRASFVGIFRSHANYGPVPMMKTTASLKPADVTKKWIVIDAENAVV